MLPPLRGLPISHLSVKLLLASGAEQVVDMSPSFFSLVNCRSGGVIM